MGNGWEVFNGYSPAPISARYAIPPLPFADFFTTKVIISQPPVLTVGHTSPPPPTSAVQGTCAARGPWR
eukprot:4411618-Pleurochrysis_carterae.AAC.1